MHGWPADKISVAGEIPLFDQRLLLIEVYPVSFLASQDSIRTIKGFSIAVSFDSTQADWSSTGLGPFQPMVKDSPIIGYHPVEQSHPISPEVYRGFNLIEGPSSVPEYVILTATGLDGWWIDSLAWHRVDLNGFDVVVFNKDGELLYTLELQYYTQIAVADMDDDPGLELVVADGETLYLYSWNPARNEFTQINSITFALDDPSCKTLLCYDLNEDGYCETVYYCGYEDPLPGGGDSFYSILVYDWCNETSLSERTWEDDPLISIPCAGILGGSAEVGFPRGSYDPLSAKEDSVPAQLLDSFSVDSILCEKGLVASSGVRLGLFADWRELVPGLDAFIVPAENQCLAWNEDGRDFSDNWHVYYDDSYEYSTTGISPPALGDLDNDGIADVLSSTLRNRNGLVIGMDFEGNPLISQSFPFTLPEGVDVSSGFSIADIDRDGKIEIVFGTDDCLLHCWELGSCTAGYTPWPQHRHDAGRSGVLE